MKSVRGYGRSVVEKGNLTERKLQKTNAENSVPFAEFAKTEDSFTLSLWISIIDKIISKPTKEDSKTKAEQKEKNECAKKLRQRISSAALGGKIVRSNHTEFAKQWNRKIAAHSLTKQGADFPKGRWYEAFLGVIEPTDICDNQITELVHDIDKHIHEAGRSIRGTVQHKRRSLLRNIIETVKNNTLKKSYDKHFLAGGNGQDCAVVKKDWDDFCLNLRKKISADFDIAAAVKKAILKENEDAEADKRTRTPPYTITVQTLRQTIWEKFSEKERDETFRAGYNALKACYRRLLKGRGNITGHNVKAKDHVYLDATGKRRDGENAAKKLERLLPDNTAELKLFLCRKHKNRDINHYIRLGKILHYTAARIANKNNLHDQDKTDFIIDYWSEATKKLTDSFYWTSEGQTRIKQNEAFVRVWRRALAFANRTLKDWADPDNNVQGDATIGKTWNEIECAFEPKSDKFSKKYKLLFGKDWQEENKLELMRFLKNRLRDLRAAVFHFKGMAAFVSELKAKNPPEQHKLLIEKNYLESCKAYREKPLKIMQGAQFEQFFTKEQIENILAAMQEWDAVSVAKKESEQDDDGQDLPLPTLKRVLLRVKKSWQGKIDLPPYDPAAKKNEQADKQNKDSPENRKEVAAHAQYIAIKMLYEKPFRAWLAGLPAKKVNDYITEAVERATKDAQANEADKEFKSCIVARATGLPRLQPGQKIDRFFYNLMAATATEMRVQKDYQSDGEQARKQAKYIENLKCDVVALALAVYLSDWPALVPKNAAAENIEDRFLLQKLAEPPADAKKFWQEIKVWAEKQLNSAEDESSAFKLWLFFLLHLMPVEEAASLRSQIRKWEIVVGKAEAKENAEAEGKKDTGKQRIEAARIRPLLQVLDLYIELHDEQFNTEKEKQYTLSEEDKEQLGLYYEGGIEAVLAMLTQDEKPQTKNVQAIRGLREMRRFGNPVLDKILKAETHKISKDSVDVWQSETDKKSENYGKVAEAQKQRKALHKEWVAAKEKGTLGKEWWVAKKVKNKNEKKYYLGEKGKAYADALKVIIKHKEATAQVELQNHLHLHKLLMAVLGRLVDFSGLFERDLYFTMLALFYEHNISEIKEEFRDEGEMLKDGKIPEAFSTQLKEEEVEGEVKKQLKAIFKLTARKGEGKNGQERAKDLANKDVNIWIRNRFAHLAVLENEDIDLTRELNFARALMAYDRKLKNAVTLSLAEMIQRNKLEITWEMGKDENSEKPSGSDVALAYDKVKTQSGHYLFAAELEPRLIYHLGQKNDIWEEAEAQKTEHDQKQKDKEQNLGKFFAEKLQNDEFVSMVQMMFGGGNKKEAKHGRKTGTIKFFNEAKGFGFIKPDDGSADIFVHISAVQASGLENLQEGQKLSYKTEPDKRGKGSKAVNLKPLS